jgi:hypothetical protein
MNTLSVIFPFIIVAFLALVAFFVYRSPLDLQIVFDRTSTSTALMLSASWSALTVRSTYTGGGGYLSLFFLGKRLIRREILHKTEILKRQERGAGSHIGLEPVLQILSMGSDMIRFVRAVLRHLSMRRLEGAFTVGLENPADTGMLFGSFSAIRPLLFPCNRISLAITPVFDREVLEGHIMADIRISRPLFIPVLLVRMATRPPARRLIRRVASHTAGSAG